MWAAAGDCQWHLMGPWRAGQMNLSGIKTGGDARPGPGLCGQGFQGLSDDTPPPHCVSLGPPDPAANGGNPVAKSAEFEKFRTET